MSKQECVIQTIRNVMNFGLTIFVLFYCQNRAPEFSDFFCSIEKNFQIFYVHKYYTQYRHNSTGANSPPKPMETQNTLARTVTLNLTPIASRLVLIEH